MSKKGVLNMEKIKAEAFNEYINDYFPGVKTIDVGGIEVIVKRHLTMEEMIDFVNFVSSNCFQDDDDTYMPELKDFLIRREIITRYTNIELPEEVEAQYAFIYGSDLISKIIDEVINRNEFNNILQGIDCKIAYIEDVAHKEYKRKIDEIYSSIIAITDQISNIYNDMSTEELTNLMKVVSGMSEGTVSDEKIARAIMQYKSSQQKEDDN